MWFLNLVKDKSEKETENELLMIYSYQNASLSILEDVAVTYRKKQQT